MSTRPLAWPAFVALGALVVAPTAPGCIHRTIRQRLPAPTALEAAPLARSSARRVAVAFVPPGIQPTYVSSVQDDTYYFDDAHPFYVAAFRAALGGRVAALDFAVGTPPPGHDVYLYPQLRLEIHFESGFFNRVSCIADYQVIAADAAGQVIARQGARSEQTFVLLARANDACQQAMARAFREATWPVLQQIDLR